MFLVAYNVIFILTKGQNQKKKCFVLFCFLNIHIYVGMASFFVRNRVAVDLGMSSVSLVRISLHIYNVLLPSVLLNTWNSFHSLHSLHRPPHIHSRWHSLCLKVSLPLFCWSQKVFILMSSFVVRISALLPCVSARLIFKVIPVSGNMTNDK